MHALTAMLNHRGGRVLFGVEPDGRVIGQQVSDRTLEDLAQEIGEIEPPVFPAVERVAVADGREVLVVTVPHGPGAPLQPPRARRTGASGNVNARLSRDEYNRMLLETPARRAPLGERARRRAGRWPTSMPTRSCARSRRRSAAAASRTRARATRRSCCAASAWRATARCCVRRWCCSAATTALELRAPQCLLRVARFRGIDRTEFIDNRQFHGNVFALLQRAERFLRDSLPVAGRVMPGLFERVDDPLYPLLALREALANAFCHRDYSIGGGSVAVAIYDDRLEVTSSGRLHFGLTPEALLAPHESLPWNPLIARVMYRRGLIEQWGRGTLKIVELLEQAGPAAAAPSRMRRLRHGALPADARTCRRSAWRMT